MAHTPQLPKRQHANKSSSSAISGGGGGGSGRGSGAIASSRKNSNDSSNATESSVDGSGIAVRCGGKQGSGVTVVAGLAIIWAKLVLYLVGGDSWQSDSNSTARSRMYLC